MTDDKVRQAMAVGVTMVVVILLAILNMLVPVFGSTLIILVGVFWVSIVRFIYGEQ